MKKIGKTILMIAGIIFILFVRVIAQHEAKQSAILKELEANALAEINRREYNTNKLNLSCSDIIPNIKSTLPIKVDNAMTLFDAECKNGDAIYYYRLDNYYDTNLQQQVNWKEIINYIDKNELKEEYTKNYCNYINSLDKENQTHLKNFLNILFKNNSNLIFKIYLSDNTRFLDDIYITKYSCDF